MQNAHERFGTLEFTKRMKDTTTRVRVHIDRAALEPGRDDRGPFGAHLISMVGRDSEIGALWAAVIEGALFQIQLPGHAAISTSLGPEAQCFRGSVRCGTCGCVGPISKDETGRRPRGRTHHFVRRRSGVCALSRCVPIWFASGAGVGAVVHARAQSAESNYPIARPRMLTASGQRK